MPVHAVRKHVGMRDGINRLTLAQVGSLDKPGRNSDGEGPCLNIARRGSKSWEQRISIDGIRRDIGLGGYPTVSLAEARGLARRNKSAVASGVYPIEEKRRAATPTFRKAALQVHRINLPTWRNRKPRGSVDQNARNLCIPNNRGYEARCHQKKRRTCLPYTDMDRET